MKQHGFTLIELLVVVAIFGILATFATIQFAQAQRRNAVASQIKILKSDLTLLRSEAMMQRRSKSIGFKIVNINGRPRQVYRIYSSAATDISIQPREQKIMDYGVVPVPPYDITFDERGLATNVGNNLSICINTGRDDGYAVDSIVVSMTRIQLGKWTIPGGLASDCTTANINNK